jgi:hypothetical protein
MISEEIFYCQMPAFQNYPETKLKCHAYRCQDNTMFVDGYYEFSINPKEYQNYHLDSQIKTKDEENTWIGNLYCIFTDEIAKQFDIVVDVYDQQGYWDFNPFPKFIFSYIYDAYNDI